MQPSLTVSRTIAVVASALSLCTACFYIPSKQYQPPPPDLITVSANRLHFSSTIGQISEPQRLSIANISSQTVTISPQSTWFRPNANNPYTFQTDCGAKLAPGASCTITVTFKPVSPVHNVAGLLLSFEKHESHTVWLVGTIVADSTSKSSPAKP